jgi:hypothetical protein
MTPAKAQRPLRNERRQSSKLKIRNSKQIHMTKKIQSPKWVCFELLSLVLSVSVLFRISSLEIRILILESLASWREQFC